MTAFVVLTNQRLTNTTQLLTLQNKDSEQPFHFEAGQYAAISFKWRGRPTTVRCFSIVNPPTDSGILQLGIQIKGRYTRAITLLEQGETVTVHGAYGHFTVDPSRDKNIILLAGGIGITPFISMVRYLTRLKEEVKITLVYGCRDEHDVPFADELLALEQLHRNFRVVFVISNGIRSRFIGKKAAAGRITAEIMDKVTGRLYLDKTFFVCGSKPFMEAMVSLIHKKGTPPEQIITESFTQNKQNTSRRNWAHRIYGLTTAASILGFMIIVLTDLVHTMPVFSVNMKNTPAVPKTAISNEEALNKQVNALPMPRAEVSALPSTKYSRL